MTVLELLEKMSADIQNSANGMVKNLDNITNAIAYIKAESEINAYGNIVNYINSIIQTIKNQEAQTESDAKE